MPLTDLAQRKRDREDERKIVVIDIGGILLDGKAMTKERAGKEAFLAMLFQKYHVVSWTSKRRWKEGTDGNRKPQGESRVKWGFGKWRKELLAELYGVDTTETNLTHRLDGFDREIRIKDLSRVLALPAVEERLGRKPAAADILCLDDTPHKLALSVGQSGYTFLFPPTWSKDLLQVDRAMTPGGSLYKAVAEGKPPPEWPTNLDTDPVALLFGGASSLRARIESETSL